MISPETLARLLPDYLPRQRWFGAGELTVEGVTISDFAVWRDEWPGLVWALVDATLADGAVVRFQVFVGLRAVTSYEHFLDGKGRWLLGDIDTADGLALAYDALVDPELALEVFTRISPTTTGTVVRPITVEQSNTSVIIDDRWILKVFRRVEQGVNPDVAVPERLWDVGFHAVAEPVAAWRYNDQDLAVVRNFLAGATDGFVLAQTSLRDLCSSRLDPAQSGGDFAPEARRLGEVTAALHVALAEAFGSQPGDGATLATQLVAEVERVEVPGIPTARLRAAVARVAQRGEVGTFQRIHGDYHLGQTMRADSGWYVLDFEGEPVRHLAERTAISSPLRDVAGMLRSFHYAAAVVLTERDEGEVDDELRALIEAWEERARASFLEGYRSDDAATALAPADRTDWEALLRAFMVAKATYEVHYEQLHRPEWVEIPLRALHALLAWTP